MGILARQLLENSLHFDTIFFTLFYFQLFRDSTTESNISVSKKGIKIQSVLNPSGTTNESKGEVLVPAAKNTRTSEECEVYMLQRCFTEHREKCVNKYIKGGNKEHCNYMQYP